MGESTEGKTTVTLACPMLTYVHVKKLLDNFRDFISCQFTFSFSLKTLEHFFTKT